MTSLCKIAPLLLALAAGPAAAATPAPAAQDAQPTASPGPGCPGMQGGTMNGQGMGAMAGGQMAMGGGHMMAGEQMRHCPMADGAHGPPAKPHHRKHRHKPH